MLRRMPDRKRNMFAILKNMLTGRNEFASGGLLFMIVGGLSVYLRVVPQRLWHWLAGQTTMIITDKDDDAAFVWVKEWFLEQKFLKRIRRVDLDTTLRNERIAMIPAPGKHWFWYGDRPFEVCFLEPTTRAKGRVSESNRLHSECWGGTALSCNVSSTTCCNVM
jgi:hypothetical protein